MARKTVFLDRKTLYLNVVALEALVTGMLVGMMRRDPIAVRDIVTDDTFTDVAGLTDLAHFPAADKRALQKILDDILHPVRTALGAVPPYSDEDPDA